jgi:hypothetical protein
MNASYDASQINTPSSSFQNLHTHTYPFFMKKFVRYLILAVLFFILLIGFLYLKRDTPTYFSSPKTNQSAEPTTPVTSTELISTQARCGDTIAYFEPGELYCNGASGNVYKQTIRLHSQDGKIQDLYSTVHPADKYGEEYRLTCDLGGETIRIFSFSPNCNYAYFDVDSWEWTDQYIMNVQNNNIIFKAEVNGSFGIISDIIWSPDNSRYVIVEEPNLRGGPGERALHASDISDLNKFSKIWTLENDIDNNFWAFGEIKNVRFVDNDRVEFRAIINTQEHGTPGNNDFNKTLEYTFSKNEVKQL